LYKVITYKDRAGNDEVAEYIQELNGKMATNKDARIHYKKIMEYIGQLQAYGVAAGEPVMKHIKNTELWELRPTSDRIFFAYWKDDVFVLLSHFVKKSQKTPMREIERAERNMKDFVERYGE
jgi:phage-related protein